MGTLTVRIGGGGPVLVETGATGWRLIVHGRTHATGVACDGLHTALRELAQRDHALARHAFGIVCNCAGSWEDEYTEEHGDGALVLEDWLERIALGGVTWVDDDGALCTGPR